MSIEYDFSIIKVKMLQHYFSQKIDLSKRFSFQKMLQQYFSQKIDLSKRFSLL